MKIDNGEDFYNLHKHMELDTDYIRKTLITHPYMVYAGYGLTVDLNDVIDEDDCCINDEPIPFAEFEQLRDHITELNGEHAYSTICFRTLEDAVAFKLRWSN